MSDIKIINTMLNTNFGKVQIGEIKVNPNVLGEASDDFVVSKWYDNESLSVQQIARVMTVAEQYAYLYMVENYPSTTRQKVEFYFVCSGYLYDKNGYLSEIEVGEYLGNLETLDQKSALDAFMVKAKEEID